ncbi:hypothetical protein [Amycolatopsis sp. RTGN1]|uniref:hypothetical protein n=1 Tax=Amycolatopsis ponsaeliensis TaxID=2992142 RepID=UPI00254F29ED|nr:hypothetical protein [Amycolatopsis sp. RTGN1]
MAADDRGPEGNEDTMAATEHPPVEITIKLIGTVPTDLIIDLANTGWFLAKTATSGRNFDFETHVRGTGSRITRTELNAAAERCAVDIRWE